MGALAVVGEDDSFEAGSLAEAEHEADLDVGCANVILQLAFVNPADFFGGLEFENEDAFDDYIRNEDADRRAAKEDRNGLLFAGL